MWDQWVHAAPLLDISIYPASMFIVTCFASRPICYNQVVETRHTFEDFFFKYDYSVHWIEIVAVDYYLLRMVWVFHNYQIISFKISFK